MCKENRVNAYRTCDFLQCQDVLASAVKVDNFFGNNRKDDIFSTFRAVLERLKRVGLLISENTASGRTGGGAEIWSILLTARPGPNLTFRQSIMGVDGFQALVARVV